MNKEEILLAYRSGKLTIAEAKQKLFELRNPALKCPLSEGQKGLWMLQKTSPDMSAYNVPVCFRVGRKLEPDKFQQACRLLLEQYPILQTVIGEEQGVPYQIIQPAQPLFFENEDISALSPQEILPYLRNKIKIPFRLEEGPLLRIYLFTRPHDEGQIVLINIHHLIFDGGSLSVFVTKLLTIYQDLLQEKIPEILTSSASYNDFVEWEQAMLASKAGEAHLAYWKQQLSGTLPVLELPTDHPRSDLPSFEGQVHTELLSQELSSQLKAFSDSLQVNPSVMFLGLFKVLLYRYTSQADLIIGLPTFGRSQERFSPLIGYFINMIPIRSQAVGTRPFSDYLRELQLTLVDGLDHAEYPFSALVRSLNVPRTPGTPPVFQVIFLYQNFIQGNIPTFFREEESSRGDDLKGVPFEFVEEIHQAGEYEVELEVFEQRDTFKLHFKYDPQLFEEETIARMAEHYLNLILEAMKDPHTSLDEYWFLSKAETQKLLIDWNATQVDYPREKCVHELFEEQAQKTPEAVAVVFEGRTLTYRELDEKSAQLAIYLQKQGVTPDNLVGICVERHWEMIVGLLGILKAGGAYVPLDPDYPTGRLEYMLEDSKAPILLTQSHLIGKISQIRKNNPKVISLDQDWVNIQAEIKTKKLKRKVTSEHLAYVIYTSGSTGKPKGVMIPHRALTNFLIAMSQKPGLSSHDRLLAVTTFCFDIAGLELYLPLINGARVCICSSETAKDVEKLKMEIQKYQPTVMQATPVTWTMLFRTGWRNEERIKILCGGEALSETLKQSFMNNQCELWNMFGPTETTIWSTIESITKEKPITLGRPIANTQIYIIGQNLKPTPIGIPGELCIAGDGLAKGYLHQPELTQEKFIDNPFEPGKKLYRTGDLARWTNGGTIEFLGRVDHQVKIRGFRIELGEIESVLSKHQSIRDAVVVAKEDNNGATGEAGSKCLCAYLVADNVLTVKEIREYLSQKLPEYMIPSYVIQLEKIPLTPNGKIDRQNLPEPERIIQTGAEYQGPRDETEKTLAVIWENVLGVARVGIDDNFFMLGGHSLKATIVISRIDQEMNVEIPLREIFQKPTIRKLALYIRGAESTVHHAIKAAEARESYPASSAQKRLYILDKFEGIGTSYNIPLNLEISGELNREQLETVFQKLVKRHEAFRTSFQMVGGELVQRIHSQIEFGIEYQEATAVEADELLQRFDRPFILGQAPLIRVKLIKLAPEKHILCCDMHHIIADGTSLGVLAQEIKSLYAGQELPELRIQYKDFTVWQNNLFEQGDFRKQEEYWLNKFRDALPVLNLPTDYQRPAIQNFNGDIIGFKLGPEETAGLVQIGLKAGATMNMVLMAIFNILLYRYTGQEDMIIGLGVAGRHHVDLESVIGMFINMMAIRSHPSADKSFREYLAEVKELILEAFENQDYPFETLVGKIDLERSLARNPLFDVAFMTQDMNVPGFELKNLEFKPYYGASRRTSKLDLTLYAIEITDGIYLAMEYCTGLFKAETIQRMAEHYQNIVRSILRAHAADPEIKIAGVELFSETETQKILIDWNATQKDYPREKCVHELFEEQAQKTPEAIAVVFEDETLTYRELDEKSAQLAVYLQKQGIGPDSLVGICVERHWEMLVGLLGILKAGGAYVPLDPEYPDDRLQYMLENSDLSALLTQARLLAKISRLARDNRVHARAKVVALDKDWADIQAEARTATLKREADGEDLAYVIYTSGSTGRPKGVMIPHRALTNFLISMSQKPGLSSCDKLLAVTTFCFDIAGLELYLPLINGARVCICSPESAKNIERLKQEIQKYQPTIMQATPVTWTMLFRTGWRNEERIKILCGGEALSETLKQSFMNNQCELWNMFGPTETTIWSTIEYIREAESITLGRPIANTQIYIVDGHFKPTPVGIPGELCIAGDGLARGYLNQPELTAEKFVPNPFYNELASKDAPLSVSEPLNNNCQDKSHPRICAPSPLTLQTSARLYKTGDLARWTKDGKIEFLRRMDHQVKIRGFRIELGEIESQLSAHPDIQDGAVIVKEQGDHRQLLAFYIAKKPLSQKQLRVYLSAKLPEYMIPATFIELEKMPLTPNGKHDRKALSNYPVTSQRNASPEDKPSLEIEKKVLEIWREVLQRHEIGLEEGFFDVGGDSFLAVMAAGRINEDFNCSFSVTELFQYANIREIGKYIAGTKKILQSAELETVTPEITGRQRMIEFKSHNGPTYPGYYQDSIAIIGISCQFPGAGNYLEFWDNLRAGKESVKFFSKEELTSLNLPKEVVENPNFVPVQATIEDKDLFDPGFFNISPKDAELMDPQFRLLLLHSWKAVEDAGYVAKQIPETSVFMSASNSNYQAANRNVSSQVLENSDGYVSWLLAQSGTIPTMISHKLGFEGPSYSVHANCSSSLVGLYSACQSLRTDKTKYALVGAATIHPKSPFGYVHQPGLNFSSDGHLKAFDMAADGMIGGEGVAVVVLKKAAAAIADGDHIYALLRGIDVNNDGADKVGYYAPSVKGQAEVIRHVIEAKEINPESISYIEAHGTGTKLGDPIEFKALNEVYRQYTTKTQFCGIGSVKPNIGHLDTAAGLAGCIKVALSLYHKEIPPSINYKEPNPNIGFKDSPFYVVDKLQPWENTAVPRRAALSSFGIGGTNTHAILEEYVADKELEQIGPRPENNNVSYLIPLSARNKERLKVYAQRFHEFLQDLESNDDLANLAYTLQVGREAMESRAAFIAGNINELSQKLAEFATENEKIAGCLWGEAEQANDIIQLYEKDEEHQAIIHQWIAKGKVEKLAGLWVKGLHVDWELLYPDHKPRRISLPTYPFAGEHYWIPESVWAPEGATSQSSLQIHPLLHQNTSTLYEQRFSTTFSGREFFLADHVIQGRRILPAVAYLEMARAAVEASLSATMTSAAEASGNPGTGIGLKNVVWIRPIAVDNKQVRVHIGLYPEDSAFSKDVVFEEDAIAYEIYSEPEEADTEPVLHSRGMAVLGAVPKAQTLDLPALQAWCTQSILTASQCYEAFRSMGTEYGPGHRGIEALYIGTGQVLAKLVLPSAVMATGDQFVLHPSLMDAALQAPLGLVMGPDGLKLGLPFALQELEIISHCTAVMWAWIRYSEGSKGGDKVEKLDIDLCDEHGNVCVRMKGYSSRTSEGEPKSLESLTSPKTLMFEPVWREIVNIPAEGRVAPDYTGHLAIFCEPGKDFTAGMETRARATMAGVRCLILQSKQKDIGERFQIYAIQIFEEIRQIFKDKPTGNVLLQVVLPMINEQQLFSGLSGLLKTAGLENPKLLGQTITVDVKDPESAIAILKENSFRPTDKQIRYQDGKIWVAGWREVEFSKGEAGIPWKDQGIYLLTGGAGGLGGIFAAEIVQQAKKVTLILTGRNPLSEEKQTRLKKLEDSGTRIIYKQTDVTQQKAVTELIQNIREEFGGLNGIIHCAGVIHDNFILKKTTREFQDVLAPKVIGLVNLDEASKDLPLDFFIVFSSVSSSGSVGQADYSTANAFMDAYAGYRNLLVAEKQRQGQTLSINWPLWQEGGMGVDAETGKKMRQNKGVAAMETKAGLRAFYHCLDSHKDRVMVMSGDAAQIRRNIELDSIPREAVRESAQAEEKFSLHDGSLTAETLKFLKNTLAKTIKLPPEKIQPEAPFEKYGLDSILQITVIGELEKITGELPKTLLFEYNSTQELADYLLKNYAKQFMASLDVKSGGDLNPKRFNSPPEFAPIANRKPRFMRLWGTDEKRIKEEVEDIAIIGISGRYPLSNTLEELWEHLKAGDNCITEASRERWSASLVQTLTGTGIQPTEEKYYGGFLEDIHRFDHYLFEIPREEVWGLSPELRLFLEIVWETFEDGGYTRLSLQELQTRYKKGIGVFVGTMYNLYPFSIPSLEQAVLSANATDWHIANRASHFFNLTGPSIAVNSACSSSLTAIHLACESLKQRNCSMAIAGGINLTLDPSKYYMLQQTGFLGSGNESKSFGTGDGYIPGEGVGAVLLKPLSTALKDHDRILAVIKSSFVNHSGGRQMYSAPDPKQQAQLIIDSIQRSGIDPETIGYVESAANGSELGDPIEVIALKNAFGQYTAKKQFCALGSVKSNLGHLEAASGLSQLSKVILQLKHQTLVPTINANPRNPNIKLENTAFYLQEEIRPWSQFKDSKTGNNLPRRSMINSFGAGGSFANLIIEEYNRPASTEISDRLTALEYLIVFSAKTAWSLLKNAAGIKTYVAQNPAIALRDIELRLQKINHNLENRAAIIAISSADLLKKLDLLLEGRVNLAATDIYLSFDAKSNEDSGETIQQVLERKDLRQLAEYWVAGTDIDFRQLYENYDTPWIDLPKYAFDHNIEFNFSNYESLMDNEPRNDYNLLPEVYEYDETYLKDHTVYDERVLIGVTHGSLAINAFFKIFPQEDTVHLHKLTFIKPIEVKKDERVEVLVEPLSNGPAIDFQVLYRYGTLATWNLTATGNLQKTGFGNKQIDINSIKESYQAIDFFNQNLAVNPIVKEGESFRTITQLYQGKGARARQILARVVLSRASREENHEYVLHPLIIHSAFQAVTYLLGETGFKEGSLPFGIKDIYLRKIARLEECWVLVTLVKNSSEMIVFDAEVVNDKSEVVAQFYGCSTKRIRAAGQIPKNADLITVLAETGWSSRETAELSYTDTITSTSDITAEIQKFLTKKLAKIVPDAARLNNLEVNLMELGLASAQLVAMAGEIEKETNIELYPTVFFEYPSLKELTEFFAKEHRDSFSKLKGVFKEVTVKQAAVVDESRTNIRSFPPKPLPIMSKTSPAVMPTATSAKANPAQESIQDDIAIIGMHGLFAEAQNLDQFWHNLAGKKDVIKEIPPDHWDYRPWYDANPEVKDKIYCKWGSFIDDVDKFDPGFFNISPREAEWMDPQLRLMLQSVYATGEDAGYINQLRGSNTGVFMGVCFYDYLSKISELNIEPDVVYSGLNNAASSFASRISFLFDLKGPSNTVDTACSSSLTALHYACNALRNKECDIALVGGANLLLTSGHYRYFSSMMALSPTGRCHTFDETADGYVPGECIASILLKPLQQAKRDGDRIYAVIKGSAALHGGYTPSFTAPSVAGEENVVIKAWEDAGINPETLGYIEAHGTGTKLGDPVEINSLKKAFQRFTRKEHFCAIGSVKASIGHTEGAAGIAGLLKVILQMRNKQIPAMPQFKKLNPYIQLDKSPLYINEEMQEWQSPAGVPRRAGVSSFGISGAYAHVVLEEYIPEDPEGSPVHDAGSSQALIVLSAKNEERLKEQAQGLLGAIRERQFTDNSLSGIAYTLQTGREAMDERLGLMVGSIQELEEKLHSFIEGQADIPALYRGQVKRNKEALAVFTADEELQEAIDKWIQRKKYAKFLTLWVKGLIFDWNKLYDVNVKGMLTRRHQISLPTYPFAKERYWLPEGDSKVDDGKNIVTTAAIHPLLHQNTSDFFSEQRFSSTFTGREFFLADHVVKSQRVLPGVAYLEMARAAVASALNGMAFNAAATRALEDGQTGIQLKNVVWVRPIMVGTEPIRIHIGLFPEEKGEISYEIYTESEKDDAETIVYNQGKALLSPVAEIPNLDLKVLKEQCDQNSLSSIQFYEILKKIGFDYGPGHKGIEALYVGTGQVLAKLSLPSGLSDTKDQFILHPSLMDSALQATVALGVNDSDASNRTPGKVSLPFALHEVEIFSRCTPTMWALVKYSEYNKAGDKLPKLDIDLCDDQGKVSVRMKGLSSRVLEGEIQTGNQLEVITGKVSIEPSVGKHILTPVWDVVSIARASGQPLPSQAEQTVIIGGTEENRKTIGKYYPGAHILKIQSRDTVDGIIKKLEALGTIGHLLWIAPGHSLESLTDEALIKEQNRGVLQVFRIIKALLHLGYDTRDLNWTVITIQTQSINKNDAANPAHASIHGLIGSMAKEYPNWKVRLIDLEASAHARGDWPIADIMMLPADPQGDPMVFRGREWYRQCLLPVRCPRFNGKLYRTGGVYVVIGGAGGIGEAWSEYMIQTYGAQLIWIGRRPKDATIQAKLDRLATMGPVPEYITADATDRKALEQAYKEIKQKYAQIHGVVHGTIVLADQSLAKMDEERFKSGLSAKVDVSVRMAQVFHKEPLDFVLFFSSINSFSKAPGQSNYNSGCAFNDAFASQLARQWPCTVKIMNWGYWGSIGRVASQAYQDRMAQAGIGSIEPPEAMEALETLLDEPIAQMALIRTRAPRTTKPLIMGEKILDEFITIYPPNLTAQIQNIRNHIPTIKDAQIQRLLSEDGPQTQELNGLLCKLLWSQLQSIGLFTEKNPKITDLKNRLRDVYGRWLEESIRTLARKNYLTYDGEVCTLLDMTPIDTVMVWQEWDQKKSLWMEDPDMKARVVLLEAMLRALPEILTGKRPATDVMFPNSSMELVEGIYKQNLVADYFNEVLVDTLVSYIQARITQEPSARIRIIEVGAGIGGTSAAVFRRLKPFKDHIQEYCYTDISKAFLMHAEKEYGPENPYLTYRTFNVEKPVAGEEIDAGGYDVVVATNVLHATVNIRQTMRNVKATLKTNGLVLLNELCANDLFSHLTFGLLDGWWLYEDTALRIPGCPGLYPETWQAVLESEGFQSVFFPAREARKLGQQIMVAESDGIVRQKLQSAPQLKQTEGIRQDWPLEEIKVSSMSSDDSLAGETLNFVKQIIAKLIKLSPDKLDTETPFEKYGIDSILQVNLIRELEQVSGGLSKTLLFEYSNIQELVNYLIKNHGEKLSASLGWKDEGVQKPTALNPPPVPAAESPFHKKQRFMRTGRTDEILTKGEREDIAIIGISGRYPLSNSLEELWEHLKTGDNCITEVPGNRWQSPFIQMLTQDGLGQPEKKYYGGFLEHIDRFDHHLFGIAQERAMELTPELRLFLEIVWETFEDAGYTRDSLQELQNRYPSGVGVFVGTMYNQYFWSMPSFEKAMLSSNGADWQIANRVSHFFNLTGPSMAISTACSSSLTAIHLACESLKQQSCSMAIAGGINLTLNPSKYEALRHAKLLGSGGQSKSFGIGDGLIPGEGVSAVVLKSLSRALQDHDRIYSVIKSSAVNHSGGRQMYSAPDPKQQTQLIVKAIQQSGIDPATISYVESAANGSALGDPIEVVALSNAFTQFTKKKQFCALGSVKSNLGHLEAASGISQLSKVLLQIKHQTLVPTINANPRNPDIKLEGTAFYLQETMGPWHELTDPQTGMKLPRRSMINSFGAGGSYANLIVEEFIDKSAQKTPLKSFPGEYLLIFSAKTEWSLFKYLEKMQAFLKKNASIPIGALAQTSHKMNHTLEYRAAIQAYSIQELFEKLNLLQENRNSPADSGVYCSLDPKTNLTDITSSVIQQAVEKKDLKQLAQYWVAGAAIDFRQLDAESEVPWIDLPKYAFEHNVAFNFSNNIMKKNERAALDDKCLELVDKMLNGELSEDEAVLAILKEEY